MKKMLFVVTTTLMLLGALSTPPTVRADGDPRSGNCGPTQMCKP